MIAIAAGAVRAADDRDCRSLFAGETDVDRNYECDEDAQLCRRAHEQTLGVGDERTKVGHCADAQEDERRIDDPIDALVQVVEQTVVRDDLLAVCIIGADLCDLRADRRQLVGQTDHVDFAGGLIDDAEHLIELVDRAGDGRRIRVLIGLRDLGCHRLQLLRNGHFVRKHYTQLFGKLRQSAGKQFFAGVEEHVHLIAVDREVVAVCSVQNVVGAGDVDDEHAETYREQQVGLKLLVHRQVDEQARDDEHDQVLPKRSQRGHEARAVPQIL